MRRRNQNRTVQIPPLFRVLHVLPGGFLQVFLLALVDEVLFVEPFERLFMLPHRALEDAAPVFRILLAVNVGQRKLLNLRVILQQPEKIARFDGGVLPRVAHEQHPVVVLPRQLQDLHAFAQRIQTRFIDDHVCPRRRLLLRQQESRHRLRLFEALLFQHVRRRIRRRDEVDICDASRTQSLAELLQRRSFARARHAAEQVEPVFGAQQAVNQHRLRLPRPISRKRLKLRRNRIENIPLLIHQPDRRQFALNHNFRSIIRIRRIAAQVPQFRNLFDGLFQLLQLDPAEVPVQHFSQYLVELQNALPLVQFTDHIPHLFDYPFTIQWNRA